MFPAPHHQASTIHHLLSTISSSTVVRAPSTTGNVKICVLLTGIHIVVIVEDLQEETEESESLMR